jgi:ABC-type amino acid transport system permease subunit
MKLFFKHTIEGEVAGAIPKSLRQSLGNHPPDLNLLVALLKKSPVHTSIELGELTPQTRNTFQSLSC